MPSPDGEIACYIDATLEVKGELVDVMVAHDGNTEHVRDRFVIDFCNYRLPLMI